MHWNNFKDKKPDEMMEIAHNRALKQQYSYLILFVKRMRWL